MGDRIARPVLGGGRVVANCRWLGTTAWIFRRFIARSFDGRFKRKRKTNAMMLRQDAMRHLCLAALLPPACACVGYQLSHRAARAASALLQVLHEIRKVVLARLSYRLRCAHLVVGSCLVAG